MEKKVGINQRISIKVMEMAMKAALDGCLTPDYTADLASGEYQGGNRVNKARGIIGKLTLRNPLFPYIKEHEQEYFSAIKYTGDRTIIFTALINAAYTFGYDALAILGKFFHVQDEVSTQLIINRMASIYASNRSLHNGLYCIIPMYIEAGLLKRPRPGLYIKNKVEFVTPFAFELYKMSFLVNNPMLTEDNLDCLEHPYFEFGK